MNQEDEKIYQKVKETFAASTESDEILAGYTKKLTGNAAKYSDAWGYASRVGGNVSDALLGAAPEIFNAEDGYDVVMSALRDGYEMTSKYAAGVQTLANREAGIGLKGVEPVFMTGRASGIAHAASNAEDLETTEAYLGQPVQLFTENVVGDTIKANEEFQYKSGLNPKIRRTAAADCCEWCNDVAGDYSYPADDLIYRRHANCNCLVEYYPGNRLKQNSHTKRWTKLNKAEENAAFAVRGPSIAELSKRVKEGISIPDNGGIIATKIIEGEYSLKLKHQKYLQHVQGTKQYENAVRGRRREQSFLTISEKEAQKIIYDYAGRGKMSINRSGDFTDNREYVSVEQIIGKFYEKGEWHETNRLMIIYTKDGSHIVPVKNNGY